MKRLVWIAIGVLTIMIVATVGVYYYYQLSTPKPKVTFTIAIASGVSNLDPGTEVGISDKTVEVALHETLVKWNNQETEILPSLATAWESVGNESWRFHLRQGVRFHDGTPFNASVVKYVYERLLDGNRSSGDGHNIATSFVKSVDVEDDYTVLIHNTGPTPYFPSIVAETTQAMVSPSAIQNNGNKYLATHPVGTGPFEFVEWIPNEYIKFKKNEDYWGQKAKLDEVIFRIIPEESTRYMAFLSGELDAVSNVPPQYIDAVKNKSDTAVFMNPAMRMIWIMVNMRREPFTDIRVRQAICYAIDQNALVDHVLLKLGIPATVLFTNSTANRLPESEVGPGGVYPYNPEKAKSLLAEAGWTPGTDGIVAKDGKKMEFEFMSPVGRYLKDTEMVSAVSEMLRLVGIKANVKQTESVAFLQLVTTQQFDMTILGFGWSTDCEPKIRPTFYTYGRGVATWTSWSGPDAAETDALLDKGAVEMDPAKRKQYYWDAQKIILQSAMLKPIYFTYNIYGVYTKVKDFWVMPQEYLRLNDCYIEAS